MSGFNFSKGFKQASPFRPMFNVGCLMDVQTGRYIQGAKGEWILNGGISAIEGITGPGNSMKSTLAHARLLIAMYRYAVSSGFSYDTENSSTRLRFIELANQIDPSGELASTLDEELGRFGFTSAVEYDGTAWFGVLKAMVDERVKNEKMIETPFVDKSGKPIAIYAPVFGEIDSLSQFWTAAITKKVDGAGVGESEMNTVAMQSAAGKAQLLDALPVLTGRSSLCITMTAHMGDVIVMDQYNAPKKKLAFVKNTRKMKKVPENFTFLTNNLFEITDLKSMINQGTKQPEFPLSKEDDMKGSTDLMVATVLPIRTKSGVTGIPFELIFSQTYGLQTTLSEYWYCKNFNRFGLSSNVVTQYLEIYPDVKFTRNNIRQLIKEDPKFRRAMEITSELCQMRNLWLEFSAENLVEPAELYKGLKEQGYDWDQLLSTRGYWTFDQYTNPIPFMSTRDLLELYNHDKKPYWMK
jgi:hypothetical protein